MFKIYFWYFFAFSISGIVLLYPNYSMAEDENHIYKFQEIYDKELGYLYDKLLVLEDQYATENKEKSEKDQLIHEIKNQQKTNDYDYPYLPTLERESQLLSEKIQKLEEKIKPYHSQRNEFFLRIHERFGSIPSNDNNWLFSGVLNNTHIEYRNSTSGTYHAVISPILIFHGPYPNGTASTILNINGINQNYSYSLIGEPIDFNRGDIKTLSFFTPLLNGAHNVTLTIDAVTDAEDHRFSSVLYTDVFEISEVDVPLQSVSQDTLRFDFNPTSYEGLIILTINGNSMNDFAFIKILNGNQEIMTIDNKPSTYLLNSTNSENFKNIKLKFSDTQYTSSMFSFGLFAYAELEKNHEETYGITVKYIPSKGICAFVDCHSVDESDIFVFELPEIDFIYQVILVISFIIIAASFAYKLVRNQLCKYVILGEGDTIEKTKDTPKDDLWWTIAIPLILIAAIFVYSVNPLFVLLGLTIFAYLGSSVLIYPRIKGKLDNYPILNKLLSGGY